MKTKKDQIITRTTEPKEMYGKYLAENVIRSWDEDFTDEDTGEVVSVERSEIVARAGEYVDNEIVPMIMFHVQAGDVKEVVLSNQKRAAFFATCESESVWAITVDCNGRKLKLLLYAKSVDNALEIAKDFVELEHEGPCSVVQAKDMGCYLMIENKIEEIQSIELEKKHYRIEAKIISENMIDYHTFIVKSTDVDGCMALIKEWVSNSDLLHSDDYIDILAESAVVIPCCRVVEKEFSQAYF